MRLVAAAAVACLLGGCSGKSDDPGTTSGGTGPCAGSSVAADVYTAGIVKTSNDQKNKVKLVDALPAPPAYGPNKWTVQILDANDKPLAGAMNLQLKAWMPNHGHGSPSPPVVGTVDAQGTCVIDKIDFAMAGVWRITVAVNGQTTADSTATGTQFAFCIDG